MTWVWIALGVLTTWIIVVVFLALRSYKKDPVLAEAGVTKTQYSLAALKASIGIGTKSDCECGGSPSCDCDGSTTSRAQLPEGERPIYQGA